MVTLAINRLELALITALFERLQVYHCDVTNDPGKAMVNVSTKEELKSAMDLGAPEITIVGSLANDLHRTKRVAKLGAAALAAIAALGVAAVPTGGLSMFAMAPVAALTGMEISAIILALSVGVALILAIFKEYEEIGYSDGELILRKKRK